MEIIKADRSHKEIVLNLLDDFRTACMAIIAPEQNFISTTAKESGSQIFEEVINSSDSEIFLVKDNNKFIGIATIHKIPQIRLGSYCAEIEEMYVQPEYQGKGIANKLMESMLDWAKENNIIRIRLESSNELKRAHGFYEKMGFRFYGKAYEKILENS